MPQKIEPGDIVKIGSSPLLMTVSYVTEGSVMCLWFDSNQEIKSHKFEAACLVLSAKKRSPHAMRMLRAWCPACNFRYICPMAKSEKYPKPLHSRNEVNRAGQEYMNSATTEVERDRALAVINKFSLPISFMAMDKTKMLIWVGQNPQ